MAKKISIEKNISRMEEIVEMLESNDVDLEKALKLFEEGIKISQKCHQRLSDLESRVRLLTEDARGDLTEKDMENIE
jgi:exodeoxyribonuclease VII small subunit